MTHNKKFQSDAAKRYDHALDRAGEDYTSIANQLDIAKPTAHSWSVGEKILNASASKILLLCEKLNIEAEWLIFGVGSMERTHNSRDLETNIIAVILESLDDYSENYGTGLSHQQKAAYLDILYEEDLEYNHSDLHKYFLKRIKKLSKLNNL
ncbi:MAG: hypothetical protein R8G33_02605 [Gammaproteobacteria bacterium]|nr:hypothetical protein [Gammaproteobacteria bacterium]